MTKQKLNVTQPAPVTTIEVAYPLEETGGLIHTLACTMAEYAETLMSQVRPSANEGIGDILITVKQLDRVNNLLHGLVRACYELKITPKCDDCLL